MDEFGQTMNFRDWVWSRKFSIFYVVVIWSIVAVFDFASTRNCEETWQLAFACDQAIWMIKIYTKPLEFVMSWFTAPWFHNGLDHILFVTIFGFLLPVQSFEVQFGTKRTVLIFFTSYILISIFHGVLFNFGLQNWPESQFFAFGFERNWMGGSLGFYSIIGALSYCSRKKWFLIFLTGCFEIFNLFVIDIDIHISFIHLTSCLSGFMICWVLKKNGKIVV